MRRIVLFLACVFVVMAAHAAPFAARDVRGSHDNPIVSRFAGSVIVGYQRSGYGQLTLPLGKTVNQQISHTAVVEGQITRIAYTVPPGKSALEVWRNFHQALAGAGFVSRYTCAGSDGAQSCGSDFDMAQAIAGEALIEQLAAGNGHSDLMINTLWPTNGKAYLETAHLDRPGGAVDVVLLVSQSGSYPAGVLLQVCMGKSMTGGEVHVDAKAMSKGLARNGHIALYGIHFASDSARLTSASGPTLTQMATLMKAQPALKVYIVGHTDDSGTLAHNLALSQLRAEAVRTALIARGIAANRMAAKGLASYAPVASNHDAAGRARNRRVELVEQ